MGNCLKLQRSAVWADGDEWEEELAGYEAKAAAAAAEAKVEVKIRVTRRQLQELLEKAGGQGKAKQQAEKVLAELMTSGRVCYKQQHEEMRGHWRPALYSIPESSAAEES
ncbi:hypothetical protein HU200_055303 [Digitaria exilis]|uniref:Uncharacterized protein n=1 Tax=Digitaria exilis TaxID=1010633 RepID=A0A835ANU0_9POAL|nr:hypothetical protein HU200_055303 [Digitaria exilis]CAB3478559.1 unnamed protein product [Digitaria exilis]